MAKPKNSLHDRIELLVTKHIDVLSAKYKQAVHYDDYGNLMLDDWFTEVNYFVENVLLKDDETIKWLEAGLLLSALTKGKLTNSLLESLDHTIRQRTEMTNTVSQLVERYVNPPSVYLCDLPVERDIEAVKLKPQSIDYTDGHEVKKSIFFTVIIIIALLLGYIIVDSIGK